MICLIVLAIIQKGHRNVVFFCVTISSFNFLNLCFAYLGAQMLGSYTLQLLCFLLTCLPLYNVLCWHCTWKTCNSFSLCHPFFPFCLRSLATLAHFCVVSLVRRIPFFPFLFSLCPFVSNTSFYTIWPCTRFPLLAALLLWIGEFIYFKLIIGREGHTIICYFFCLVAVLSVFSSLSALLCVALIFAVTCSHILHHVPSSTGIFFIASTELGDILQR